MTASSTSGFTSSSPLVSPYAGLLSRLRQTFATNDSQNIGDFAIQLSESESANAQIPVPTNRSTNQSGDQPSPISYQPTQLTQPTTLSWQPTSSNQLDTLEQILQEIELKNAQPTAQPAVMAGHDPDTNDYSLNESADSPINAGLISQTLPAVVDQTLTQAQSTSGQMTARERWAVNQPDQSQLESSGTLQGGEAEKKTEPTPPS